MGIYTGPNISASSSLIRYLDAGNPKSYGGTGSTWTDLCGNANATKAGSQSPTQPAYNSGGWFNFTGGVNGNNYSRFDLSIPSLSNMTAITWHRPTVAGGHVFRMSSDSFQIGADNYAAGIRYNDVQVGHSVYGAPTGASRLNKWNCDAVTWDGQTVRSYAFGVPGGSTTRSSATTLAAGTLRIGARSDIYAAHYVGDIAIVAIFSSRLSDAEIFSYYHSTRSRFGLSS